MNQPSLFLDFDQLPDQRTTASTRALAQRDHALNAVESKASADLPDFFERSRAIMLAHLRAHGPATGEQLTDACIAAGIVPENSKAFGSVVMKLSRSGEIVKAGFAMRNKGHGSVGNLWAVKE